MRSRQGAAVPASVPTGTRKRSDPAVKPGEVMPFAFNLDEAPVFDPQSGMRP